MYEDSVAIGYTNETAHIVHQITSKEQEALVVRSEWVANYLLVIEAGIIL
jgi:hypothetical protein